MKSYYSDVEAWGAIETPHENISGIPTTKGPNPKHYFKDVWCLGPSYGNYPGAFPRGLMNAFLKRWNGTRKLMLFSGSFKGKGWTTVDIKPELEPDFCIDTQKLPEDWTEKFDLVFADPPYSEQEAADMYGLPYINLAKVVNEMARVTSSGGHMALIHRLVPQVFPGDTVHFKRMKIVGVIGIYTMSGYSNIRALTVWRKSEALV